jgi:hypothetical protein
MTNEKFDTRINDQGQTEFAYGISWKNTSQASLIRNGRSEIKRREEDPRFLEDKQDRFEIQANKQTKLDLEDQAVTSLQQRLIKEQLCSNGYKVDDVTWRADNIRLLGYCL